MTKFIILILIAIASLSANGQNIDSLVNQAIRISLIHMKNSVEEIKDTTQFPTYGTKELLWKTNSAKKWTSGFYPGSLWLSYELSGDPKFAKWANSWTQSLKDEVENDNTHDLGFKFGCTYGNGQRLGDAIYTSTYKEVLLAAAKKLSERYYKNIGCLSSDWDAKYYENSIPVLTDIMMNLELLLWASENGGPKEYKEYAISHALKTYQDFVREDGSTYHIVRYDRNSGNIINKGTLQGDGDETTWTRGHAWTVYGMVMLYRYTNDKRFYNFAINLADYFIEHLEDDNVSLWDFDTKIAYRDVSATAIVTSALFELVNYVDNVELKNSYKQQAEKMLSSLCQKPYFIEDTSVSPILDHSVHHYTNKSNTDVPASFADYYFLEALIRYKENTQRAQ